MKLRVTGELIITALVIASREAAKQSREQPQYIFRIASPYGSQL
jgi:hypothetical protein